MHSVLVILETPEDMNISNVFQDWHKFLNEISKIPTLSPETIWHANNVLQIPLKNGLQSLSEIVTYAVSSNYTCKILFFSESPSWITP